jgi:hypothetical protein
VLLLEPIYEQDFFDCSYGTSDQHAMRTKHYKRSAQQSWQEVEDGFSMLTYGSISTVSIEPSSEKFSTTELPMV